MSYHDPNMPNRDHDPDPDDPNERRCEFCQRLLTAGQSGFCDCPEAVEDQRKDYEWTLSELRKEMRGDHV